MEEGTVTRPRRGIGGSSGWHSLEADSNTSSRTPDLFMRKVMRSGGSLGGGGATPPPLELLLLLLASLCRRLEEQEGVSSDEDEVDREGMAGFVEVIVVDVAVELAA